MPESCQIYAVLVKELCLYWSDVVQNIHVFVERQRDGCLRKINKISSLILTTPADSAEQLISRETSLTSDYACSDELY